MKKVLMYALIIGSAFTVNKVTAQQGFSLSIKSTPQFSFFENKDDNNNGAYSRKTTFNANFGIGGAYNFTNNLGIGVDVLYSLQGQRYKLSNISTDYYQKNNYLKIPLYFSYNTNASKAVSFIGKIGPQVSIITSSKLDDKDGNKIISDSKDRYKSATFGAMALAGVQYKLDKNLYLSTAVRYDYDFTNAEDDTYSGYTAGRAKTYNMVAGLEVGLKYVFK